MCFLLIDLVKMYNLICNLQVGGFDWLFGVLLGTIGNFWAALGHVGTIGYIFFFISIIFVSQKKNEQY